MARPARVDLQVDLGERLQVYGQGLDARLQGDIRLIMDLSGRPQVHGLVQIRGGSWRGVGRDLQIEQGTLRFTGDPEDPVIDLVAWRRHQPVEAGVHLTVSAGLPVMTLLSRPEVPEPDKLSWLVLGTAFDTHRGGRNAALQAAAEVVVAGSDRTSPVRSLSSNFGLERLSIRTTSSGAGDPGGSEGFAPDNILTLGRRLSERLFLSYEQSLRGLQNLVRLQYQITEHLSFRLRAGSQTGIDLHWTRRDD
jgi:translocation and assembly module TamB